MHGTPPPRTDTRTLVAAAIAGQQWGWDGLVERFDPLIRAVARGHRLQPVDTADVVQTTWLQLVDQIGEIRQPSRLGAWLATTARHASLRLLRESNRCVPTSELGDNLAAGQPDPDASLLAWERDRALWRALCELPPRQQLLLRWRAADPPVSYEAIAAALEIPVGSIGPTTARSLERLRRQLDPDGG